MKLRNKKTGEKGDFLIESINNRIDLYRRECNSSTEGIWHYNSLAELEREWEDYEEPKEYWFIDEFGMVQQEIDYYYDENKSAVHDKRLEIGNHFDTPEEAEKAVEKLKAWKRLKDKGFRIDKWIDTPAGPYRPIWFYFEKDTALEDVKADLDLLFGGEE